MQSKPWIKPEIKSYGSVEAITEEGNIKTIGKDDGFILVIPGLTPPEGVPIGSL